MPDPPFFWKALLLIRITQQGRRPTPYGAHRNWTCPDPPVRAVNLEPAPKRPLAKGTFISEQKTAG
jgi:hypothetical protein